MANDRVARRVEAEGLVDDLGRVPELVDVGFGDRSLADDEPDLFPHPLLLGLVATEE
jgi:hypothetical protein